MFHLADISNSTKQFDICLKWCEYLFVEFFHQGDTEKQLGHDVSQFMDRCTTNIAKGQVGFINFIIKPSFEAAHIFLPGIHRNIENMEINKSNFESRIEDGEARMLKEKAKWEQLQAEIKAQATSSKDSSFEGTSENESNNKI